MTNLANWSEQPFPVFVEYEMDGHIHLIQCAENILPEDLHLVMANIECYGEELAESVMTCNEDRHRGHGITHLYDHAQAAYGAAVNQLLTKDFQMEWRELQRKQRVYKLWGGHPPAIALQPKIDDAGAWEAIIPDKEGRPRVYEVRKNVLEDMMDPREFGAKPNRYGSKGLGGWTVPKEKK